MPDLEASSSVEPNVREDEFLAPGTTILQVVPRLVTGGAERGCVDIAAALVRAGCRAIVASAGGGMVHELDRAGALHITLPLATKNPIGIWRNVKRLSDLIATHRVALIHARSRAPAWAAMVAANRCGIPFVTTAHAPYSGGSRLKCWYNAVMAKGDRVIAISDYVARYLTQGYGVGGDRLRTIHRGIDLEFFSPERVSGERMVRISRAWGLPDGMPVVMLPGRLTRWKGADILLQAIAQLPRNDVCCVLVGHPQGRRKWQAELEAMVHELGLSGRVRIAGHCNDMPAAYMLADVVVHASVAPEAFGRVIVEAQAMRRPTIVADTGAVEETVRRGETAWVVPPANPQQMAVAIHQALSLSPRARDQLGATARAFVASRFDRKRMCQKTLAVYQELTN